MPRRLENRSITPQNYFHRADFRDEFNIFFRETNSTCVKYLLYTSSDAQSICRDKYDVFRSNNMKRFI